MSETMNIHETDGRNLTEVLPAPIRNFMEETRRALIATRAKHGANTPIGHRCSNIVEMLENGVGPATIANGDRA
jgi:hypothetical protein